MSVYAGVKLRRIDAADVAGDPYDPVDRATLDQAAAIIDEVRADGEAAVRRFAERFGEREAGEPLVLGRDAMEAAYNAMPEADRAALTRAAERIKAFAEAQRSSIKELSVDVPGGKAGHTVEPVAVAGCYAPAGRYPLPSSALMTAVTARAAGCERVIVASPGAPDAVLAAAWLAGADEVHAIGGAHAVASMAMGTLGGPRCDVIVGPGNRYVTAAKQLLSGVVGIDMLAGPSELVVLADETAEPSVVAADLLAQAEHDVDARAILVTTSAELAEAVDGELQSQLAALTTRETAAAALANGFCCVVGSIDEAIEVVDAIAPEHLEVICVDERADAARIRNAGAVFIGAGAAEVVGDYGVGPNHTLPTGGTARFQGGLSIIHFLRLRTWIEIPDRAAAKGVYEDTVRLAEIEGLAGHAASASARLR